MLTPCQCDALQALADGRTAVQHAEDTQRAYETVKYHLERARAVLGAPTSTRAVVLAIKAGEVVVR